jgi:hypothetical protein
VPGEDRSVRFRIVVIGKAAESSDEIGASAHLAVAASQAST